MWLYMSAGGEKVGVPQRGGAVAIRERSERRPAVARDKVGVPQWGGILRRTPL